MQEYFNCKNCQREVKIEDNIGTRNRNHCPFCLCSIHVDLKVSGDRNASCHGIMRPIALTFKNEGFDKYGHKKQGEIMLVHLCEKCGDISINRISGDDSEESILKVFDLSAKLSKERNDMLLEADIVPLDEKDAAEVKKQLFGATT